ncbi:MAG: insulinase family protein, partial [bacterium]
GEHMPRAMDVLGDISLKSLFQQQDLHKEKDVILQEISMVEDTPDDLIHDLHCREFWADQSLGRPVLGTPESLRAVERAHVVDYHTDRYQGDRMIITAAGALDPEVFLAEVSRTFGSLSSSGRPYLRPAPTATPRVYVQERQVEQVHFCAGYRGLRADDHRRYAMFLLNTLLGGGMSSRLFQKIREEYGLAYSVYSYHAAYQDTGMHAVYCGTSREGFAKALEIINDETRLLASERVGAEELTTGKRQLKGNLLLGLESTSNRMNQLARDEIYFGRHVPVEEIEEGIETVTADQIRDLAADLFRKEHMALTVIGPVSEDEVRRVRG